MNTSALMEMDASNSADQMIWPRVEQEQISIIRRVVADYFGIAETNFNIRRRVRPLVTIRHLAMLLCCELTPATRGTIGLAFNRDHSDVTHSIMSFKALCESGGVCGNYWSLNFFEVSRRAKMALGRPVASLEIAKPEVPA
jgi:chromosomal replication initiation ATPase DnaA